MHPQRQLHQDVLSQSSTRLGLRRRKEPDHDHDWAGSLDGEAPAGDELLACYNVAQAPGQREFRLPGTIALECELASQTLTVRSAQRTLCVPTERR